MLTRIVNGITEEISQEEEILIREEWETNRILQEKEQEKTQALQYLNSTDWVISKISEQKLLEKDISDLLIKYEEVLTKRNEFRNILNK